MRRVIAGTIILTLVLTGIGVAGSNPDMKAALHVLPHGERTCAKNFPTISEVGDIIYTEPGPEADVFPVFYNLVEWGGFDYGLTWPGLYTCAFTSCSDFTIGGIVNPGDGVSHAWSVCKFTPIAVAGAWA